MHRDSPCRYFFFYPLSVFFSILPLLIRHPLSAGLVLPNLGSKGFPGFSEKLGARRTFSKPFERVDLLKGIKEILKN
jgi:hypothetical protein